MRNAAAQYQKVSNAGRSGGRTPNAPRSTWSSANSNDCTPGPSRVRALGRNHTLWSILVQDLSLAENRMPEGIKTQLISLGLWSMRYSTLAMLKDLPVTPLAERQSQCGVRPCMAQQKQRRKRRCANAAPRSSVESSPLRMTRRFCGASTLRLRRRRQRRPQRPACRRRPPGDTLPAGFATEWCWSTRRWS